MSGDARPFPYGDYALAKRDLLEALAGPCFYALVLGGSGMGKTCLVRELMGELDSRRHHIVYLSSVRATITGIVALLARRMRLRRHRSYLETLAALTQVMRARTSHLLLWLDEAEQLDTATLERLRSLVEAEPAPSFSVVLCGNATLQSRLEAPRLFALTRRITLRCRLAGLRRDELDAFLVHRFGATEAAKLPSSIRDDLFERTGASPALLNRVVNHLLVRHHQGVIDDDQVRACLDTAGL